MEILLPNGWPQPKGYANGVVAEGRFIFTAGVIGWTSAEKFERTDLVGQFAQALLNTRDILHAGGANPSDIVRMTCYVVDINAYRSSLKEIGAAWRDIMGRVYPAMSVIGVAALVEKAALVEIETTAVAPPR